MESIEEFSAAFEQHHSATAEALRELQESYDRIEAKVNRPGGGGGSSNGVRSNEVQAAWTAFLRSGDSSLFEADMSGVSDPDGGYTIPSALADSITDQLLDGSPMRRLARVEKVSTPDFAIPVNKRGASSGWSVELGERGGTETPQLGLVKPGGAELFANVPVTNWLLDDSKYDIASFVALNVTDEFNAQENTAFILGDGVAGKPRGFLVNEQSTAADSVRPFGTLQTIASGHATELSADSLVTLVYALRAPYRQGDGVGFLMNGTTISKVRKMKTGDGSYIWADSLAAGQPPTLLGYPVYEAEDMPAVGAGYVPVAFGNWRRGYVVQDIHGMKTIRDPYTRKGVTFFYFAKRTGGTVLDSNAIKLLKIAAE